MNITNRESARECCIRCDYWTHLANLCMILSHLIFCLLEIVRRRVPLPHFFLLLLTDDDTDDDADDSVCTGPSSVGGWWRSASSTQIRGPRLSRSGEKRSKRKNAWCDEASVKFESRAHIWEMSTAWHGNKRNPSERIRPAQSVSGKKEIHSLAWQSVRQSACGGMENFSEPRAGGKCGVNNFNFFFEGVAYLNVKWQWGLNFIWAELIHDIF